MNLERVSVTILTGLLLLAGVLAWTGPARIEARAQEAVLREQALVAAQGAARLGAQVSGVTDRLTDPVVRAHVEDAEDLHVAVQQLVRREDTVRGVAWLIHDDAGHVVAASNPMLEQHTHEARSGSWASGPGVCDMCFEKMGAVSIATPLPDGTFLAANVSAEALASSTLRGLRTEDGQARLVGDDGGTLFEDGAGPVQGPVLGFASVPGTPWTVEVATPRSLLAPAVRADAVLLLAQALALIAMAALGVGVVMVAQRRALGRELEAAHTMAEEQKLATIGLLSAGVSHEMRNALTAAVGLVDLVRLDPEASTPQDLADVALALRRASDLSRDLSAFSRVDRDEPVEVMPVSDLVEEAVRLLSARLRNSPVEHEAVCHAIQAARGPVVQVLVNLLLNAAQAMDGRPGQIRLSTRIEGGQVQICVDDEGSGVPAELRGQIFQPLFTTKPRGSGTGIGLWLSRRIAREQGGDLVLTDGPSVGARFMLSLPIAS